MSMCSLRMKRMISPATSARKTAVALKIRTSRLSADTSIEKLPVTLLKNRGQITKEAMSLNSVARALYYHLEQDLCAPLQQLRSQEPIGAVD